jgi:hypothetical protein
VWPKRLSIVAFFALSVVKSISTSKAENGKRQCEHVCFCPWV